MDHSTGKRHHARALTPVFTMYATLLQLTKDRRVLRPFAANCHSEILQDIRRRNSNTSINTPLLQHRPCHLCYDGVVHEEGGRAPGREDRGWTLSRWWIKRLPSCASGAA